MLKVPFDSSRLFDGDEAYFLWMAAVANRVSDSKREIDERERAEMNKAKQGR